MRETVPKKRQGCWVTRSLAGPVDNDAVDSTVAFATGAGAVGAGDIISTSATTAIVSNRLDIKIGAL